MSLIPGGARRQRIDLIGNEDRNVIRNRRTSIEDLERPDLWVHGHYREGRIGCARLQRSSGGLMMVVYFRSFSHSPFVFKLRDTTHL